jgi:Family of unknown function (DUF6152)
MVSPLEIPSRPRLFVPAGIGFLEEIKMGTCKPQRVLLTIFGLLAVAASAFAHHSFSAEFQTGKEFKVTGVMTKVDWINPHIHFFVDVKDDSGNVATWDFEGLPPNMLHRHGLTRSMFKLGEVVTVTGVPYKDGSKKLGYGKSFKYLSDGHEITMWTDKDSSEPENDH